MIDETQQLINDLLSRWHDWKCTAAQLGYPTTNAACRMYRCSRQHDSENGALDGDIEGQQMEAVDACIDRVPQPYNTALQINARNLCTGATVWRSARLPDDRIEAAALLVRAREILLVELQRDGVA
jgi:hypothetical protein